MSSVMTTRAGGRGSIAVRRWPGADSRYLVAIAHGIAEHSRRYEHVAGHLVVRGATVVAPDHWGHGRSEGEPGVVDDLEAITTDFAAVIGSERAERPGLPLVVVGHSLGGIVATRYVQRHPGEAAALVLSGPVIDGNDMLLSLVDLAEIPDIPIEGAALSRDPAVGDAYFADPLVYHGPVRKESLQEVAAAVQRVAGGGGLGDVPTLWIHGELDPLAPLAETTRAFEVIGGPGLEQKVYAGAMHEVFNETNRDEVLADVDAFIAKHVG